MNGMGVVFRREMAQVFNTRVSYLVAAGFLLMTAFAFNADLTLALTQRPANPAAVPTFLSLALVFFAPILTMRTLAEEQREGTLELLLTSPITDVALVLGKFAAAWCFYTLLLLVTLGFQVVLATLTPLDLGHVAAAYIGIWLYGGAALAIGVLFSALTENQIVAAFLGGAVLLLLWSGDAAGEVAPTVELAVVLRNLSFQGHFSTSFAVGIVRLVDLVYYTGVVALALYLSIQAVESKRWR